MLSGFFYIQAAALLSAAVLMALFPPWAHLIFGVVAAACFFVPGYQVRATCDICVRRRAALRHQVSTPRAASATTIPVGN